MHPAGPKGEFLHPSGPSGPWDANILLLDPWDAKIHLLSGCKNRSFQTTHEVKTYYYFLLKFSCPAQNRIPPLPKVREHFLELIPWPK